VATRSGAFGPSRPWVQGETPPAAAVGTPWSFSPITYLANVGAGFGVTYPLEQLYRNNRETIRFP